MLFCWFCRFKQFWWLIAFCWFVLFWRLNSWWFMLFELFWLKLSFLCSDGVDGTLEDEVVEEDDISLEFCLPGVGGGVDGGFFGKLCFCRSNVCVLLLCVIRGVIRGEFCGICWCKLWVAFWFKFWVKFWVKFWAKFWLKFGLKFWCILGLFIAGGGGGFWLFGGGMGGEGLKLGEFCRFWVFMFRFWLFILEFDVLSRFEFSKFEFSKFPSLSNIQSSGGGGNNSGIDCITLFALSWLKKPESRLLTELNRLLAGTRLCLEEVPDDKFVSLLLLVLVWLLPVLPWRRWVRTVFCWFGLFSGLELSVKLLSFSICTWSFWLELNFPETIEVKNSRLLASSSATFWTWVTSDMSDIWDS